MYQQVLKFQPETIYHIYNHGNAGDNIFKNEDNYLYFLEKYKFHFSPVADTIAYCLLPNHFHFAIKIKSETEIRLFGELNSCKNCSEIISCQASNWLNAYAKGFNKENNRVGSLFRESLKRKIVSNNNYLLNLVNYIHHNAVSHGFATQNNEWKFSSFNAYFSNRKSNIAKEILHNFMSNNPEMHIATSAGFDNSFFLDLEY